MARPNYYTILGVQKTATQDEIKRAYRTLAMQYHPDRNPDDVEAERRFRQVVDAYETLSDPERRQRYDALGPFYKPNGAPPTPEELGEILSDTLGGLFRKRRQGEPGEDLRYTLTVTLEEVTEGVEKIITVPRQVSCQRCAGRGAEPDEGARECAHCDGSGRAPGRRLLRTECPRCDGRGYVIVQRCERCEGEGRHGLEDRLRVRVPRGVATGQKLKLAGRGNAPRGNAAAGDLYVVINVADHPLFRRRGADLICEVPLSFAEAVLGVELTVPTLEGTSTIRIPPGTASGTLLRLTGRGLPQGRGRGDLHLKIGVEIPQDLTADQRRALEAYARLAAPAASPRRQAFDDATRERSA